MSYIFIIFLEFKEINLWNQLQTPPSPLHSMGLLVLKKLNSKLKFLYRKNKFLSPPLRRLLCNAIIQPHFDYACIAWFPNLNQSIKNKLQTFQNKCIRFCLQLGNRTHIGIDEFKEINLA